MIIIDLYNPEEDIIISETVAEEIPLKQELPPQEEKQLQLEIIKINDK